MKLRLPAIVWVFISVLLAIHAYLAWKIIFAPKLGTVWQWTLSLALLFLFLTMLSRLSLYRRIPKSLHRIHAYLAYCWMGLMFFLLVGFILCDLVFILPVWAAEGVFLTGSDQAYFKMMIVVSLASVISLYAYGQAKRGPKVKQQNIILSKLPKALCGFKVVQISDLHIGDIIQEAYIKQTVSLCNAQKPDLIVITGDLVDAPVEQLAPLAQELKHLSAKHGVYFVTGNHEYYAGAQAWIDYLKTLNIHTLRNTAVEIADGKHSFNLVGIDDVSGGKFIPGHGPQLAKAVEHCQKDKVSILLAHQPKSIVDAEKHGIDLQLSGHTHNGQIWPFQMLVALDQPYLKGLYQHGNMQIYVNPGTGFWGPPMRFYGRSEITSIELLNKTSAY
ncbi:metallophosphoesterase [bacterium]|nr:metallophosphoesterase [bacterium]